ncbi:uncharacterized protein LOC106646461 [Copidosoma floridanum]|uniref:uncharacterized protein LOC106646461 n=1 Tax=Copidosoma floridanum TaxID=29053 RepID=UPI0006C9E37C|nr:uncharacterized protein LOC106646461 [Copidosoma floridanum]
MFTFYQNFNARREENELQREAEMTGHDRFCQQRPGAATKRKRRAQSSRRTQSAIEIECAGNSESFANVRSVLLRNEKSASVEEDEPPASSPPADEEKGYFDTIAKILFNRVYAVKTCKEQNEPR